MKWSRTRTLVAGLALILATNAVALIGVAYNRSGEPESALKLTQRELQLPYEWGLRKENSGISLALRWRVLAEVPKGRYGMAGNYAGFGGAPNWLDKTKLATLGFDVLEPEDTRLGRMRYSKILPKEVLLVLELDGPTYRTALGQAQEDLQKEEALLKANPGQKEFEERVKNTKRRLHQEEHQYSRLFVIDAGLDMTSLRTKYPDRSHYAIVHGQIQPHIIETNHKPKLAGYVSGLSITQINVPARYRGIFESLQKSTQANAYGVAVSPFEVSVVYGNRLEPWITEARGTKD